MFSTPAEYDLTQTLASYLDLHLMFPLCEFLEEHQMYDQHDLMHAKLDMLMPTNMVDFAKDFYISLNVETNDEELAGKPMKPRLRDVKG